MWHKSIGKAMLEDYLGALVQLLITDKLIMLNSIIYVSHYKKKNI
jgi:hypothetical protein